MKLTIDDRQVEVPDGSTVLDACRKLGIEIPTLCYLDGLEPFASCFLCVVQVEGQANLVPSCATPAAEGMVVRTDSDDVRTARQTCLELLFSDHLGDCMGPCHSICPATMNIPLMIRQIAANDLPAAIRTVKADIALPAVLGRICPAPCEKGCRRKDKDRPVSIMLLKRYVADADLAGGEPYLPDGAPETGKRVAIVGAGPAGLAAAWYLRQRGIGAVLFDDHPEPGGMLRYAVEEDALPRDVLDAEIDLVRRLGAEFRMDTRVGRDVGLDELRRDFDAVLMAVGQLGDKVDPLGLATAREKLDADPRKLTTPTEGVFAAGDVIRRNKLTVRAVNDGKMVAASIAQHLAGEEVRGYRHEFTCHIGKLMEGEVQRFMPEATDRSRLEPDAPGAGFTREQAEAESSRCLHCDCRKPVACKLRAYADEYGISSTRYKGERRVFEQHRGRPQVIYEPGKCIDCGICVRIAERDRERLGLTFIGRGFQVRVGVPFNEALSDALTEAAGEVVRSCPTGALSFPEGEDAEPA